MKAVAVSGPTQAALSSSNNWVTISTLASTNFFRGVLRAGRIHTKVHHKVTFKL